MCLRFSISACSVQSVKDIKTNPWQLFISLFPPPTTTTPQPCRDPEGCGVQNTLHRQQLHHQCQHVSRCDPSGRCRHTATAKFPSHDDLIYSSSLDPSSHDGLVTLRMCIYTLLYHRSKVLSEHICCPLFMYIFEWVFHIDVKYIVSRTGQYECLFRLDVCFTKHVTQS